MAEFRRIPLIAWDRIRVPIFLVGYALLAEYADPRPFLTSAPGKLIWFAVILSMVWQVYVYRQEISTLAYLNAQHRTNKWESFKERWTANARYRLGRVVRIAVGLYAMGWMIDSLTTRCDGAVQCVLIGPQMAVENIPAALQVAFYMAMGMAQLFAMFYAMTKVGSFSLIAPGTIKVRFEDVFGQDLAKEKMQEQVRLLNAPEQIEAAGGHLPRGVLLYGPPGTGKTMLAQAVAGESNKPFIFVPPGSFVSTFVGINFLKVWQLFRAIRKQALRYGGVTVFIDEIDSLGNRGSVVEEIVTPLQPQAAEGCVLTPVYGWNVEPTPSWLHSDRVITGLGGGGQDMGTLTAFLAAMDGMERPRGFINIVRKMIGMSVLSPPEYRYFMVGATNRADALDPALTRAGRFGRQIHVGFPDLEGRIITFRGYLKKVDHNLSDANIETIARDMDKGTGAKVKDAVNEALLLGFRDGRPEDEQGIVTTEDLLRSMIWKEYGEPTGMEELESDRRAIAIHEAGHAVAAHYLRRDYFNIRFGSIERRGRTGGMIASAAVADRQFKDRIAMINDIAVSLASGVAEGMFYEATSSGNGGDIGNATQTATYMVKAVGMGPTLQRYGDSEFTKGEFSDEVEAILIEGELIAIETLGDRRDQVEAIADLLVEEHTVAGSRIHALLEEMEG